MAKEKTKNRRKRRFYKRKGLWIFLMLCMVAGLIGLKIVKESQPKRTFEMHLHHILLIDILREWAAAIQAGAEISDRDRSDLTAALREVAAALDGGEAV